LAVCLGSGLLHPEIKHMYMIVAGNLLDGFKFILNEQGFPFKTDREAEYAATIAEANGLIDMFVIMPVVSTTDLGL
jgi:hypothetical protein